jgi:hypothetical protein
LVVSNLLRNLNEVKANIQMQKTGATAIYPSISQLPASELERWAFARSTSSPIKIGH